MTSSNGNIFCITGPLCWQFTSDRWIPLTNANGAELYVFFDGHLNKRLSQQLIYQWFETPSCSLWRHPNDSTTTLMKINICIKWIDTNWRYNQKKTKYNKTMNVFVVFYHPVLQLFPIIWMIPRYNNHPRMKTSIIALPSTHYPCDL